MNKIAIIIMPYRNRAHPFAVNVHRKVQTYLHVHMRPKSGSYCDVRNGSRSSRESYADTRIRTYVIVSKQGLRSSEIVSPEICIYRDFNIFKLNESHKDALTPSKSEITEIFHDQLRFVHRGVHEIFKTVET